MERVREIETNKRKGKSERGENGGKGERRNTKESRKSKRES